jgi:putative flippase GtrA
MPNHRDTRDNAGIAYPAAHQTKTSAGTFGDESAPPARASRSRLRELVARLLSLQVARFALVGGLNTVVDYGVFNLLSYGLHMHLVGARLIGVTAGIVNSLLWNKLWTFRSRGWGEWRRELAGFLLVTGIGVGISVGGFAVLHSTFGASSWIIANLEAASMTLLSMTWNFLGYRYFVFRTHQRPEA